MQNTDKPVDYPVDDRENVYQNPGVRRNNLIFAILTILFQIAAGLIYGFLIRPQQVTATQAQGLYAIFLTVCYAFLVVAGFGLLISYLKRIVWSGLGFTLLITAFTLEYYFMINAAWGWASIEENQTRDGGPQFSVQVPENLDRYYFTVSQMTGGAFGNYIIEAFKAALANVVAFSAILGRAGPLEAWFIVLVGTVGYELNRILITRFAFDGPGSSHIFIYGAFMGLVCSIFVKCREDQTAKHPYYTANKFSSTMAILGTIICWIFFPLLAMDPSFAGAQNSFTLYTGPINVVFGLAAATFTSFAMSALINGKLQIRDIVYGPVAGGIATATASVYIVEPVWALLAGTVAGIIQVAGMNLIEAKWARNRNIVHSTSFILFGVQGILGSVWAAMNNAIIHGNSESFTYIFSINQPTALFTQDSWYEFLMGLLSIGMGLGFGLIAGIFIVLFVAHKRQDHFTDTTYWVDDDGISFANFTKPVVPVLNGENAEMEFFQGDADIKGGHAYL